MTTLYEKDFCAWSFEQAEYLKKGHIHELDIENLAEEIESLGKSERSAIDSLIRVWLIHMLKKEFTPEKQGNSRSWEMSIFNSSLSLNKRLKQCPSLKKYAEECVLEEYEDAKQMAALESEVRIKDDRFPRKCPWTIDEILDTKQGE